MGGPSPVEREQWPKKWRVGVLTCGRALDSASGGF